MSRRYYIVVLAVCIALISGLGATGQSRMVYRLDSCYTSQARFQNLVGNVAVAIDDSVIYKKSFGYQNIEKKILNTDSSSFDIGSVTKIFTATAVLQLKEKGLLQLDDNYAKYFPEFPYPEITIRQLLAHTSGLPAFELFDSLESAIPDKIFANEDVIPALKLWHKPMNNKPGHGWYYSSINYCLLAMLVEKLANSPFREYVHKNIFEPAGMAHSYLENFLTVKNDNNKAINYEPLSLTTTQLERVDLLPREKKIVYNYGGFSGPDGLVTTMEDMEHFDKAYFSGKIINNESMEEAMTPVKLKNGMPVVTAPLLGKGVAGYGLGWYIGISPLLGRMVWHEGVRPGVKAIYMHNITKNQTILIFENVHTKTNINPLVVAGLNIINNLPDFHD